MTHGSSVPVYAIGVDSRGNWGNGLRYLPVFPGRAGLAKDANILFVMQLCIGGCGTDGTSPLFRASAIRTIKRRQLSCFEVGF